MSKVHSSNTKPEIYVRKLLHSLGYRFRLHRRDLPDIATSNRQNLDEHDNRVQKLVEIVKKIVSNLITKRADLAEKIKKNEEDLKVKQESNAKRQFAKEVENEVSNFEMLSTDEQASLNTIIASKIKGDVVPKSDYLIFLSHSSTDKIITDFIYQLLKSGSGYS
jgi:D-ribose pyranose/furanose isomerase RbsD